MNKINNALEKMIAILITKGIQKEQKGVAGCWGWDYQAQRPTQSMNAVNQK